MKPRMCNIITIMHLTKRNTVPTKASVNTSERFSEKGLSKNPVELTMVGSSEDQTRVLLLQGCIRPVAL